MDVPQPHMQPVAPPSLLGEVVIQSAHIAVGDVASGDQALIVTPAGSALRFVIPLNADAARTIGGALLAKRVVMPGGQNGGI